MDEQGKGKRLPRLTEHERNLSLEMTECNIINAQETLLKVKSAYFHSLHASVCLPLYQRFEYRL